MYIYITSGALRIFGFSTAIQIM